MKCPTCKSDMRAGSATIQRSDVGLITDALLFGRTTSSAHYLYFHPAGKDEAISIDHTGKVLGCPKCQTLVIAARPAQPQEVDDAIECMSCGKTIPAGLAKCASCGWTWEA